MLTTLAAINSCVKNKNEEDFIKLLMRSPYGCTHLITIDKEGNGQIIAGEEQSYDSPFTELDYIIKESGISIGDLKDLEQLIEIAEKLDKQSLQSTKRPKDAMHYEVFVKGVKKIDAYARKSKEVNSIKDIFVKYFPFEVDYFCEAGYGIN
ncbi:hypothetical protein [Pontimicrobium sp. IMCC45349]|uniref:hypothetical protein n=1 Tax=Pontimicrobium sp. IMCC45349 TaxID=3391574 RepID=UPI00399FCEA9